jgi:hypothetical protein
LSKTGRARFAITKQGYRTVDEPSRRQQLSDPAGAEIDLIQQSGKRAGSISHRPTRKAAASAPGSGVGMHKSAPVRRRSSRHSPCALDDSDSAVFA